MQKCVKIQYIYVRVFQGNSICVVSRICIFFSFDINDYSMEVCFTFELYHVVKKQLIDFLCK